MSSLKSDAAVVYEALRTLAPDADLLTAYIERIAAGETPSDTSKIDFTAALAKIVLAAEIASGLAGNHGLIAEQGDATSAGLIQRGLLPLPPAAEAIAETERKRRRWFGRRRSRAVTQ